MSLDVALQSVAFYVLSCSTCAKINHRRKARVKAKRERAEKLELETEQPGLYRHPSPFSTNPFWGEEIMMGPGPPKQKGDKGGSKNTSQKALNTAGQGSSYASSGAISTESGSSPTAVTEGSRLSGEGWNWKRYQREDEDLWGHDTHRPGQRIIDAIAKAGSSAGRLLEGRLSKSGPIKEENPASYYLARNPPVNDLHPPVVSTQPTNRDETRWMLQPPPPAKVMEGKERVNRSRADSNGSSRRGPEGTPLSRQVTERLVGAKYQRGETPTNFEGRPQASRTGSRFKTSSSNRQSGERHDRSRSLSLESSRSSDGGIKRARKPPPISVATPDISARSTVEHVPIISSFPEYSTESEERGRSSRPLLPTVVSSSIVLPHSDLNWEGSALRELSSTSPSRMNVRATSPLQRLSPNANAMPESIPGVEPKFPGTQAHRFPRQVSQENSDPTGQES